MQWYFSKNGIQLGPIGQDELRAKISSGEISQTDMVWRDGLADWQPVSKVSELAVISRSSPPAPPAPGNVMNSPYTPPTTANTVSPIMVAPPSSGKATAAMVLGIVGLVFALCGCYGAIISLPCAILAIIFGGQFKNEVALNPALAGEIGKANAGVIMGWIALGIAILLTVLLFTAGIASSVFSQMHR